MLRIWIDLKQATVNFQAASAEEEKQLDSLLFGENRVPRELSEDPFKSVEDGAPYAGEVGGHESQRWISIHLPMVLR